MEKWEIVSHIAGIIGCAISLVTAVVLCIKERKDITIEINDVVRYGDRNYLNVVLANRSRLNIAILKIHIEQDNTFELDHRSQLFKDIKLRTGNDIRLLKQVYTLSLPINLAGLESSKGVLRTLPGSHSLYTNSEAHITIYTNRGVLRRDIIIKSDGSFKDYFCD